MQRLQSVTVDPCRDWQELLSKLDPINGQFSEGFVFRGQAISDWNLIPSGARPDLKNDLEGSWLAERDRAWGGTDVKARLRLFVEAADSLGVALPSVDYDYYQLSAIAQHYELNTNYLDWTRNPYAAAYFAASGNLDREDGKALAVWITSGQGLRVVSGGADPDSLYSNREAVINSRFDPATASECCVVTCEFEKFALAQNAHMNAQSGELMSVSAGCERTEWAWWFENNAHRSQAGSPIVEPPRFGFLPVSVNGMIQHVVNQLSEEDADHWTPPFRKLILPSSEVPSLLRKLDRLGFNGATMFPSDPRLTRAAKLAKERFKWLARTA